MRLPSVQDRLTLGDLRQELSSVFGVPAQRTRIILQGMVLKDDRLPLTDYGMTTGARVVLMATSPRGQRQPPAPGAARGRPRKHRLRSSRRRRRSRRRP